MSGFTDVPADLAKVINPLKEWITWKWVGVVLSLFLIFFSCTVSFVLFFITSHYWLSIGSILFFAVHLVLFLLYARDPETLEDNWRGILHYILIKIGFNTFSKYNRRVKKWVLQNYSGLVEMDEETGLCREKSNQNMY